MSDDVPATFELGQGHLVAWRADGEWQVAPISEVDGDFVRVGGHSDPHWLRRDDILAYGIYGDEDPIREGDVEVRIGESADESGGADDGE
ncbi:hypothetical protein BRC81_02875 [Halobacteriales archaeon QS_1_68_20]|nr:MAG: hypothetical protein BRC81_02875 [Halobacteriales archaeon QS_1_68_20]